VANTLAYYDKATNNTVKSFIVYAPGPNVKDLPVMYVHNKLECFFPGRSFDPSLMFVVKGRSLS
jgi:hypothetical protein